MNKIASNLFRYSFFFLAKLSLGNLFLSVFAGDRQVLGWFWIFLQDHAVRSTNNNTLHQQQIRFTGHAVRSNKPSNNTTGIDHAVRSHWPRCKAKIVNNNTTTSTTPTPHTHTPHMHFTTTHTTPTTALALPYTHTHTRHHTSLLHRGYQVFYLLLIGSVATAPCRTGGFMG